MQKPFNAVQILCIQWIFDVVKIYCFFKNLENELPTQIGLWAALGKNYQYINILCRILSKKEGPKYRKITDFQSKRFLIGPLVGHPCLKFHRLKSTQIFGS